jgi:hypothetical protein
MPRHETPLDPAGGPVVQFAIGLRRVRTRSGLTYRQMATTANYSHVRLLQRAAKGDKLPAWPSKRLVTEPAPLLMNDRTNTECVFG